MKPLAVRDPRGVTWYLRLSSEIVAIDRLDRALDRSGMTDREKRRRRRSYGVKVPRALIMDEWARSHARTFVMHAESDGERRAWISPAGSRRAARADLLELAAQIRLGEEPAPSHP